MGRGRWAGAILLLGMALLVAGPGALARERLAPTAQQPSPRLALSLLAKCM